MNILLLCNSFLPQIGGRELVVYYLAKSYQELGHTVRVMGPSGWYKERHYDLGFPVHRYLSFMHGGLKKPGWRSFLKEKELEYQLSHDIKKRGCDVIHAHITFPNGYIASKYKKKHPGSCLFITPHGNDIHVIPELGHGLRLNPHIRPKIEKALNAADKITAISDSMEASILDAGASSKKIVKIPNGVDLDRFEKGKKFPDVYKKYNLPGNEKIIITVGNYHERKGQSVLVKAMPSILKEINNARLLVIGKNTEKLTPLINELGLQRNVTLTGTVPFPAPVGSSENDCLAALYNASSVYVSAGTEEGSEGLSLAMLEAMAAGLPLVATDISGNRELVDNTVNGYLAAPASSDDLSEKLVMMLKNEEKCALMGKKARENAEQYSWIEVAKQYLDMYSTTCGL